MAAALVALVALVGVGGLLVLRGGDEAAVPVTAPEAGVDDEGEADATTLVEHSAQELGERFGDAVWRIDAEGCDTTAAGTAFAVSDHLLVTSAHVVAIDPSPRLTSRDGTTVDGEVVGRRRWPDLAVVWVETPMATTLGWAATEELVEGQPVTALSYPAPQPDLSVLEATVRSFQVEEGERIALAAEGITDHGLSGAPLLTPHGQVAGVVTELSDEQGRQVVGVSTTYAFVARYLDAIVDDPVTPVTHCALSGLPGLPDGWDGLGWVLDAVEDDAVEDDGVDDDGVHDDGDETHLDALYDACDAEGDLAACDQLYRDSPDGSDHQAFGDTCGLRRPPGNGGRCEAPRADGGDPVPATADDYGDDPTLDHLWDACTRGKLLACDDLYRLSPSGSIYEGMGDSCNEHQPVGMGVWCVDLYPGGRLEGDFDEGYGQDALLDALWDECAAGDWESCDGLYTWSSPGSEYEWFGSTCGDRNPFEGWCTDRYGGS